MKKIIALLILVPALVFSNDTDIQPDNTKLFVYTARSNTDMLQSWIDSGYPVDVSDSRGNTPLLIAAECGNLEAARMLTQHGVAVNEANNYGYTPLFAAVVNGYPEMIRFLLTQGADPDLKNIYGSSANDFIHAKDFDNIDDYTASLNGSNAKIGPNANLYLPPWMRNLISYERQRNLDGFMATLNSAASKGDPYAQYLLGVFHMENGNTGQGLPYLEMSAAKGEPMAQFYISKYYVTSDDLSYQAEGFKHMKQAADNGYSPAYLETGKCYLYGIGTNVDYLSAFRHFTKAAEMGSVDAEFFIGMQYFYGLGMAQNKEKGTEIIMSTSERGSKEAQRQLNRFATESALEYFENFDSQTRPMVKAYILSAGGVLLRSDNDCDIYDTRPFMDEDYGVYRISACYFVDDTRKLTFNMKSSMRPEYKAYMTGYASHVPVEYIWEGANR